MTPHGGEHRFMDLSECISGLQQGDTGVESFQKRVVNLLGQRSGLTVDIGARAIGRVAVHQRTDIGLDETAFRQLCCRVLKVRPDRNIGPATG